jgi:hypothetical protein
MEGNEQHPAVRRRDFCQHSRWTDRGLALIVIGGVGVPADARVVSSIAKSLLESLVSSRAARGARA